MIDDFAVPTLIVLAASLIAAITDAWSFKVLVPWLRISGGSTIVDGPTGPIETKNGTLYSIPYSVETNDVVMSAIQTQPSSEIYDRVMNQFECFYEEGAEQPRILSVCSHPYLSGVPHRIKYFRKIYEELAKRPGVVFWTGDQVIDWYKQAVEETE